MSSARLPGDSICLDRASSRATDILDVLLEALSYLRASAWNGFESVFEAVQDVFETTDLLPRDAARILSALGHIDVQLDKRTLRPLAWCISPPTLLRASDTEWLLCGRRSTRMIETLAENAERRGGLLTVEPISGQPARVAIQTPDSELESAKALAASLDEEAQELLVNPRGAAHLASALPTLGEVLDGLRRSTPAIGGAIEKLELDGRGRLRWRPVSDFSTLGAYRFSPPPLTYAFVDSSTAPPLRVDARLARLLALLAEGVPPLAWDPDTRVATVAFYAEPPALYERALALSSGYGPEPALETHVTRYRNVTEKIASAVYSRLSIWKMNANR